MFLKIIFRYIDLCRLNLRVIFIVNSCFDVTYGKEMHRIDKKRKSSKFNRKDYVQHVFSSTLTVSLTFFKVHAATNLTSNF